MSTATADKVHGMKDREKNAFRQNSIINTCLTTARNRFDI